MARVIWIGGMGVMNLGNNAKKLNKQQQKAQRKARVGLLKARAKALGVKRV